MKFQFLLDEVEVNEWVNPDAAGSPLAPWSLIFDSSGKFNMPGVEISTKLRKNLKGELQLQADGIDAMSFVDAHVVGTSSKLGFKIGGHGVVTMQLRFDPGSELDSVFALIEAGDCMLQLDEYDQDNAGEGAGDQENMPV